MRNLAVILPIDGCNRPFCCQHSDSCSSSKNGGKIMHLSKWGLVALGFACAFVGVTPAAAETFQLERSGNVYHAAVCPRGNPHDTARCFAHMVTDARGNPL